MTLAIQDDFSRSVVEVENTKKMCELLMKTPHYSKLGSEGIFAIVSKAKSLGMDQIEALNGGLYYVQGKVGMPAETMAALIRQKGHSIRKDEKSNDQVCILHGKRADTGDTWTIRFSMDDAKRAGLLKNMYEKYPQAMLYNRAMSFLARQLFPDIIKGAGYTLDELKEIAYSKSDMNPIENKDESNIDLISQEQANELAAALSECDPEYQKNFWNFLKKQVAGIESLDQLPLSMYDRIRSAVYRKRDEHRETLVKEMLETGTQILEEREAHYLEEMSNA